jgi:hypothetical protein
MKKLIIFPILLIINTLAFSQKKSETIKPADLDRLAALEDSIAKLSYTVVNDTLFENRQAAQARLYPLVKKALAIPNSFNYAFSKLETISIQYPQDKSFRIVTWQYFKDYDKYQYFGFVQLNRSKSTVYELKDFSKDIQKPENALLTTDKWYGALYYNIKDFKTKDGVKYLLFGFNAHDTIEKIKICDVMTLKGNTIRFGAPVFEKQEGQNVKKSNRLIMYYAYESGIRLNYDDEMGMIVHDHLTDIAYPYNPNIPFVSGPDGTYEAYKFNKGTWQHISKLENTLMDKPPFPKTQKPKSKVVTKEDVKRFEWPEEVKKNGKND